MDEIFAGIGAFDEAKRLGPNLRMEVHEADRSLQTAHLLVLAAATLIGPTTLIGKELLYVAETMSHPITVVKQAESNVAPLGSI